MLSTPRNPSEILTLMAVLVTGSLLGGLSTGIILAGVWYQYSQPIWGGLGIGFGFGMALGYTGTLWLLNDQAQPRPIPNLNMMETRITAVVPDRTEGVIGTFPLAPGELRVLADNLLVPGIHFTQAEFKSVYGLRKYTEIRNELFKRQWATPDYRGTPVLTVAGRHVMRILAGPPTHPSRWMS